MIILITTLSLFFFFISLKNFRLSLGLTLLGLPLYLIKTDLFFIKNILELLIFICFLSFVIKIFKKEILLSKIYFLKNYAWPFIFLFISLIAGIIVSEDKIRSMGVFKAWFLLPIIFGIMAAAIIEKKKDFLNFVYFFLTASFFLSIYGIWQFISGHTLPGGRVAAVFTSANYLAMFLGVAFSFIFLINASKKISEKYLLRLVFSIISIAFLLTRSEGAFLGIILAILFAFLLKFKKISVRFVVVIIILSLSAQIFLPYFFLEKIKNTSRNDFYSRLQIWYVSGKILKESSFWGIGLGRFEAVYQKYLPNFFFPPLEWLSPRPHSLILSFLLETGILGFIAFLMILANFLKNSLKLVLKNESDMVFSVLIAILFIIFHGFTDTPYWKNDLAVIFWFLFFGTGALFYSQNKKTS